jgi:hypothetical protein
VDRAGTAKILVPVRHAVSLVSGESSLLMNRHSRKKRPR